MTYHQRLAYLGIQSLELRNNKADSVYIFKINNRLVECDVTNSFTFKYMPTRDHNFKINDQYNRVNCVNGFFSFVNRAVPI